MAMNGVINIARRPMRGWSIALFIFALLIARLLLYALSTRSLASLPDAMCRWDCGWYKTIIDHGYMQKLWVARNNQTNWAFFPLFPILVRGATYILNGQDDLAGFLVANFALCLFVALSVQYHRQACDDAAPLAIIIFLFAYPYGFYYSVPYTESTYAVLTMVFLNLAPSRVLAGSLTTAILSATRVTGVLFTPVIVVRRLQYIHHAYVAQGRSAACSAVLNSVLPIAIAPLGLFVYMAYLYVHTGDAFAFVHIQRAWGRTSNNPLMTIFGGLEHPDLSDMYARRTECGFFASLCGMASITMAVGLLIARRYAEGFFLISTTLIALSAGLGSIPRYLLTNPVFIVWLFEVIWRTRCRKYFAWIIGGFIALQLYLVHLWALGYVSLI